MNSDRSEYKQILARINKKWFNIVIIISLIVAVIMMRYTLSKTIEESTLLSLTSSTDIQVKIVQDELEEQYEPLQFLARFLQSGYDFTDKEVLLIMNSLVEEYRLCMLGYADLDGNATNYLGESFGNISDREYFSRIADGSEECYFEYLSYTKKTSEPRILFSMPVYLNGTVDGVLFAAKEPEVISEIMFTREMFGGSLSIYITDSKGNIIMENDEAGKKDNDKNIILEFIDSSGKVDSNAEFSVLESLNNGTSGALSYTADDRGYIAFMPIENSGWHLCCIVDESSARTRFGKNTEYITRLVIVICAFFIVSAILMVKSMISSVRNGIKMEKKLSKQYDSYREILRTLKCGVVEYDLVNNRLKSDEYFKEIFRCDLLNGDAGILEKCKSLYPEFGFDGLFTSISSAVNNRAITYYEGMVMDDIGGIRWIKTILLPMYDAEDNVNRIIGAVIDTTKDHKILEEAANYVDQIPGGYHRCYLNDPVHVEYISESIEIMLGYTHEEICEIIGTDNNYCRLICEEDVPAFESFVERLIEKPGTDVIEYRFKRKDGSLVRVSDTMESKFDGTGSLRGYSVVIDLSEYEEMRVKLNKELKKTKYELDLARLRNTNSQMQPHFLYNALASIREIVLDDPEYASNLLYDFTVHLRACIRSMADDEIIPFIQELDNIKAYVNIEKMRFRDRLNVEYDISCQDFNVIPLGIQPLIENSIRHGIYKRGAAGGKVTIRTECNMDFYSISVEDNGVGFDKEDIMKKIESKDIDSTGLVSLIFRLEKILNAVVNIESEIGVGTTVTVTIPRN